MRTSHQGFCFEMLPLQQRQEADIDFTQTVKEIKHTASEKERFASIRFA